MKETEERQRRIDEVHRKGVFFHTYSTRTTPLSKEEADDILLTYGVIAEDGKLNK